ncbi:phage minor tail protein L [Cronobacter malonaticus]|nr:phage minor tail protein L [Cronobacter sakazakii]ELY2772675.1 phage minor tail protein L [Cronobacter sakazakii]ELY6205824.1 phage minor tail protein L [Cronobacter malonaticus]ELY6260117.1 phage minor tail protein L [Cronobacter malonaticus]
MGIKADIQSLSPSALIELFVLDMSNTTSGGKRYFHAGTNELSQPIIWQGISYEPWPIVASGFDKSGQGTLPRPKIQVSNFGGTVSAEVQANDDLVGCKITRKLTLARFLDAANFEDGNPTADPNQHFPDEMWFIEQKTLETHQVVEFELSSVFDLMGVQLPYRQIIKNTCPWKYRGAECGYTGPYFDKNNRQTMLSAADYCTKRYDSCKARKNFFANGVIHFGGFIGATRYES